MRSASERSLRARIASLVVLVAVVGAVATALVFGALSWSMAIAQEDRRLRDLLGQLDRELAIEARDDSSARQVAAEEQREIEHTGVRLAVYRGDLRISGDFATTAPVGCRTVEWNTLVRECVTSARDHRLVARSTLVALARYRWTFVWALLGAVAIVSALAAWSSGRVASRSLEPLTALRNSVDAIDVDRPDERAIGSATGYVELDALRAALERTIRRLSESLAQARRFAFNAAHEMRTPLTALRAEAELQAEQGASPQIAALAEELSRRMDRVLVLADSRLLGAGEPVSLEAVAEEICREFSRTIERDARDEGLVRGDGALLGMLLRNAIDNSLKFGARSVRVAVERRGDVVELSVEDDGPGVSERERQQLFEPFVRGEAAKRAGAEGQGLGLALIAHVAMIHGGDAAFDGARARGARLTVRLPAWR